MSAHHNMTKPDAKELARIRAAWDSGEMTIVQIVRRFSRSKTIIAEILRNSGALNNEQGGNASAAYPSGAPE